MKPETKISEDRTDIKTVTKEMIPFYNAKWNNKFQQIPSPEWIYVEYTKHITSLDIPEFEPVGLISLTVEEYEEYELPLRIIIRVIKFHFEEECDAVMFRSLLEMIDG